jgi:peroxiredoxin
MLAAVSPLLAAVPATSSQPTTSQPAIRLKPPAVGEKAPDLALQTLDKKDVKLSELLKGGPVVVVELRGWVGYQCPNCTQQTNDLISRSKEILATGAKVILVYPGAADGLQAHAQEFIAGKGLPEGYLFVTDPDKKFVTSWGMLWNARNETAYPSTFVIDKAGVVQFAKVSSTHGDRASSADILKALAGLK